MTDAADDMVHPANIVGQGSASVSHTSRRDDDPPEETSQSCSREMLIGFSAMAAMMVLMFVVGISPRLIFGFFFLGVGLFLVTGAVRQWKSFFGHWKAQMYIKLIGYQAARLTYIALGLAVAVLGLLFLTGVIHVPDQYSLTEIP